MLMELTIDNFAVIENINLKLDPGITIISGDEGSGKSLIVDAMGILLGMRAPAKIIRNGKTSARVEGVFSLSGYTSDIVARYLTENDIEPESDGTLVISRDLNQQGRSVSRINGRAVASSLLRNIGRYLLDIHGQLDYVSILDVHNQMKLLDAFGNIQKLHSDYVKFITDLKQKIRDLSSIESVKSNGRLDLLKYQIDEIERADISIGEEDILHNKLNIIQNSSSIKDSYFKVYDDLYANERSVISLLCEVLSTLNSLKVPDPTIPDKIEKIGECLTYFEDVSLDFRKLYEQVDIDSSQLEEIEQRLNLLNSLKHKYGNTSEDILKFLENATRELESMEKGQELKAQLQEEFKKLRQDCSIKAEELSHHRLHAADALSEIVNKELEDVGLPLAKFQVSVTQEEDSDGLRFSNKKAFSYNADGVDKIEFMLSTNPGEPLRPLRAIASGGETSRIMLALKSALKKVDPIPTLVFDEIDAGIGGRNGDNIGKKLATLTKEHQVICITHLPQIACYGDLHIKLTKDIKKGRASTYIQSIQGQDRVEEIAAMLGSDNTGTTMIKGAETLMDNALSWKNKKKETVLSR
jgi:DNA repair protein RecN (Recombination protein N)